MNLQKLRKRDYRPAVLDPTGEKKKFLTTDDIANLQKLRENGYTWEQIAHMEPYKGYTRFSLQYRLKQCQVGLALKNLPKPPELVIPETIPGDHRVLQEVAKEEEKKRRKAMIGSLSDDDIADMVREVSVNIIKGLTPEVLQEIPPRDKLQIIPRLIEIERLLAGKTTKNIGKVNIIANISAVTERRLSRLKSALKEREEITVRPKTNETVEEVIPANGDDQHKEES